MIRIILTDIEGTTSSISFVHQVLFPYAAEHLEGFIREHRNDAAVKAELEAVAVETGVEPDDLDAVVNELQLWIRQDRKATPLKALQGMVWRQGYECGDLRSHVYRDAADYLRRWHDRGLRLYVYSSGSVEAQKLIFGYSVEGDLSSCFSGYFDTRVGAKKEADSYRNILDSLGVEAETVLFLSDVEAELAAAEAVGMQTGWLVRDGDVVVGSDRIAARNFADVDRLMLGG